MNAAAWVFLAALVAVSFLLTIAIGAYDNLAAENRRLRKALVEARHPARVILPGRTPIFDATLAEIQALPQTEPASGGAA